MSTPINSQLEEYKRTFTTFGGCDITATFDGTPIAELQAITYSVQREKVPVYTLGDPNPRSFGRGKRGIAGSLVFVQFDREALMETMMAKYIRDKKKYGFQALQVNLNNMYNQYYKGLEDGKNKRPEILDPYESYTAMDANREEALDRLATHLRDVNATLASQLDINDIGLIAGGSRAVDQEAAPEYLDQLMPFNISIMFLNETGARARMELLGVEILNEGMSMSVDDVQLEKAVTFVARKIQYIRPFDLQGKASSEVLARDISTPQMKVPSLGLGNLSNDLRARN